MSRSPKALPPMQDESDATHNRLSLFATRRTDEYTETASAQAEAKTTARTKKQAGYSAADIQVLEGMAAIRHRPGMYIGSTSTSGLVHLIWEALDNAVDEAVAGYGAQIWVDIDRDGVARVLDEGRGMPFDLMTYQGKRLPSATVLLTVPHSGGKFGEGAYK